MNFFFKKKFIVLLLVEHRGDKTIKSINSFDMSAIVSSKLFCPPQWQITFSQRMELPLQLVGNLVYKIFDVSELYR